MPNHVLPSYLFADQADWRTWLENFPKFESGGYVPAGRFLDELELYLNQSPPLMLSQAEAQDLTDWFNRLLQESEWNLSQNKGKTAIGWISGGLGMAIDIFTTGGAVTALKGAAGLFLLTSGALDYANAKYAKRLKAAHDTFDNWIITRRK